MGVGVGVGAGVETGGWRDGTHGLGLSARGEGRVGGPLAQDNTRTPWPSKHLDEVCDHVDVVDLLKRAGVDLLLHKVAVLSLGSQAEDPDLAFR